MPIFDYSHPKIIDSFLSFPDYARNEFILSVNFSDSIFESRKQTGHTHF